MSTVRALFPQSAVPLTGRSINPSWYGTLEKHTVHGYFRIVSIPYRYGTQNETKHKYVPSSWTVSIPYRYGTQQHFVVSSILPSIGGGVKFNCIKITPGNLGNRTFYHVK